METVSTLMNFLASFNFAFTLHTAENLKVIFRGAILGNGSRTITECLRSAWPWITKHWTVYENSLRRAKFEMRPLSRTLFLAALKLVPASQTIFFIIDESLVRRYGPRVVGIGMHRDSVRSSKNRVVVTPGHKWVVLSLAVRLPFTSRAFALPILSVLYFPKKKAKRNHAIRPYRLHRTVGQLAILMTCIAGRWVKNRLFCLIGDGLYGSHDLADALSPNSPHPVLRRGTLVSRFRMDGALYANPKYRGFGRPPVIGKRLSTPGEVAKNRKTKWKKVRLNWYGATKKQVHLVFGEALWYKCSNKATRVRWVVVRDPEGKKSDEVFFTTNLKLSAKLIVEIFVTRWALETTFQEARSLLGIETLRNRSPQAVLRSVPMLMALYSVIIIWFAKQNRSPKKQIMSTPWYAKEAVTFSDMFYAAKRDLTQEGLSRGSIKKTREFLVPMWARLLGFPGILQI